MYMVVYVCVYVGLCGAREDRALYACVSVVLMGGFMLISTYGTHIRRLGCAGTREGKGYGLTSFFLMFGGVVGVDVAIYFC